MAGVVLLPNACVSADIYFGGNYRIAGTVTELGVVGSYRVRLFDRVTGVPIREMFSLATGNYVFANIKFKQNGYFVVAFDHGDNPLNAAIADFVTPEPMP